MELIKRPRRLRQNPLVRGLVRETKMSSKSLIYPLFIKEGKGIVEPIASLEGQYYYSEDKVCAEIEKSLKAGVSSFMLFGLPDKKDSVGSEAYAEDGVIQKALRTIKSYFGKEVYLITDVCLCEYTDHGHCGLLKGDGVDNDGTVALLAKTALSHSIAGADMVAPSDMMDGRITAIRQTLDNHDLVEIPILAYSAKYSSNFYGPFREAANSAPSFGDRKSYQMDYHNSREALKEVFLDIDEGADLVMVKPALSYLDVIHDVKANTNMPVVAYSVSGEYALIKAGAKAGLVDEYGLMCETATSIFRSGADCLISYYSKALAQAMRKGDIG